MCEKIIQFTVEPEIERSAADVLALHGMTIA